MKWINRLYIFFVGVLLAITTGFGVAAFYPEPVAPRYPSDTTLNFIPESCKSSPSNAYAPDCDEFYKKQDAVRQKAQQKYDEETKSFDARSAGYTRTAVFFGVAIGAFFALLGLSVIKKSNLVSNGLLLGGLLTAILTRFLISLASFGNSVSSTQQANSIAYIEFAVLVMLSIAVTFVGLQNLKDSTSST